MELSYLYYFKVIAEKENMSRAAETLHVSQPALSKTIAKLESSLGVSLFERKKGRISLSPIGLEFYRQIAKAFDCIDEAQRTVDAYKRTSGASVTIGSPVSELMNSLLRSYLTEHRQETIQISQFLYTPETLEEELISGKLDFALTPIPLRDPEITQIKLMNEEILLAVGKTHPLAKEKFVRLADCRNERFLVNDASFDKRAVTDHCKLVGFEPNITLCSNEPGMIDEALRAGQGISMVPANICHEKYTDGGQVEILRFTDIEVRRFISIVSRKDRTLMEQANKLYNFAVTYFENYGEELEKFVNNWFPPMEGSRQKGIGLENADELGPN